MIYRTHTGGRRISIGGGVLTLLEAVIDGGGGGGGGGESISVAWVVSADANDTMSINDSGAEGCTDFRDDVNTLLGTITEVADSVFLADIAGTFSTYDAVIIASFNQYMTTQQKTDFLAAMNSGGNCMVFSDNGFNGSGRTGQASRNSMGFDDVLKIQCGQDQFDGSNAPKYTTPVGCVFGAGLNIQGEGTSPWVLQDPFTGPAAFTTWIPHHDQTPNTGGTTYTGEWVALATAVYGTGRILILNDRQYFWNSGAGSYYSKPGYDNDTFVLNCIKWLSTGQSQA